MKKKQSILFAFLLTITLNFPGSQGIFTDSLGGEFQVFEKNVPGTASVVINTEPQDADVYINGIYEGLSPLIIFDRNGYNRITLKKDGYITKEFTVYIERDKEKTVNILLTKEKGELVVSANVPGAEIFLDGNFINQGNILLDTGYHTINCRAFGYREEIKSITLKANEIQFVRFNLTEAPFEITGLEVSKKIFNPELPGKMGENTISFTATAPGSITLSITDHTGEDLYSIQKELSTWENSFVWNGMNDSNFVIPSGKYKVIITDNSDNTQIAETDFFVDRNLSYEIISSRKGLKSVENSVDCSTSYSGSGVTSLYGQFNFGLQSTNSGNVGLSTVYQFFRRFMAGFFFETGFSHETKGAFTTGISCLGTFSLNPVETGLFAGFSYFQGEPTDIPAFYSDKTISGISGGFVLGIPLNKIKLNFSPTVVWGIEPGLFDNPELATLYPVSFSLETGPFMFRLWEDFQILHNKRIFSWKSKTGVSTEYFFQDSGILMELKIFYATNDLNLPELGGAAGISILY